MLIDQLSVFIENKKGRLHEITKVLSENNIDIRAISVFDSSEFGILRMIVDDPKLASEALKAAGHVVKQSSVLGVEPNDTIGSLDVLFTLLDAHDINVEYIYSFVMKNNDGPPQIILKTDNQEKALALLEASNVTLLPKEEVYNPS